MSKCLVSQLQAQPIGLNKDAVVAIASGWLSTLRIPINPLDKGEAPFQMGEVFFVKERWYEMSHGNYIYLADTELKGETFAFDGENMLGFKDSCSMPEEAARFFLMIEGVTRQRLQDITVEEMEQEMVGYKNVHPSIKNSIPPKDAFALRWNRCYGTKGGFPSWSSNPEVWVLQFKVLDASELETKEE